MTLERKEEIKKEIEDKLYEHLGFNGFDGTYIYILTRVKEAFGYGTMTLDDFVEIDGDFVGELADLFIGIHSPVLAALEEAEKQQVELWECEDCGFAFPAMYEDDTPEGGHSCPVCAESRLEKELADAQQTIALKQSSIETLTEQVVDETALHAKTAAKLIIAEQTIARQREALEGAGDLFHATLELSESQFATDHAAAGLKLIKAALGEGAKDS